MPVSELLSSGVQLMIIGMSVVFIFLGILIFSIIVMSKVAQAFDRRNGSTEPAATTPATADSVTPELLSVITTAVNRYRKEHAN